METATSDAIVFFGATGDLASAGSPALLGLVGEEGLNIPIVGVAKAGWTLDQLKARARDSIAKHAKSDPGALSRLLTLLRYVDGDYNDPQTFENLRGTLGSAHRPLHYLAIPRGLFGVVVSALAKSGLNTDARVVVEKPFGRDRESARPKGSSTTTRASVLRPLASAETTTPNRLGGIASAAGDERTPASLAGSRRSANRCSRRRHSEAASGAG